MLERVIKLLKAPRELLILLTCEYFDSFATFALDYVLMKYLSETFLFSDIAAGWIYGFYGLSVVVAGFLFGPLIDNLGVRASLIVGSLIAAICRISLSIVTGYSFLLILLLVLLPIGAALTSNVLKLGIRRYTSEETRSIAFDASYTIINCAALFSAFCLTSVRMFAISYGPYYRLYLFVASLGCLLQVILAATLREVSLNSSTEEVSEFVVHTASPLEIFKDVTSLDSLWRFVWVTFAVCLGVGTCLRQFGATFPLTFTRTNGVNSPFELVLSINPGIIVFLMPLISWIRLKKQISLYDSLIIGSAISSLAVFAMAVSAKISAGIIAMVLFTIGEMIWSPRFIEWSVMAGKEGREGTVIALTGGPKFVARILAGGMSGFMLTTFCNAAGPCYANVIWAIIGVNSLCTPVALWAFRSQLWHTDEKSLARSSEGEESSTRAETESTVSNETKPLIAEDNYVAESIWA